MPYIKANGIDIYYESHGSGEPLLLINGIFDVGFWACQVPAFSKGREVIVFDNRGIGRTEASWPYSVETFAEDALGLIDALGVEKTDLLGFSLGGCIALELAARYSERIGKMVLGGAYNRFSALGVYRTNTLAKMVAEGVPFDRVLMSFMPWMFSERFFELEGSPEGFIANALKNPYPTSSEGLLGLSGALAEYNGLPDLGVIEKPVLVISGSEDLIVPVRLSKELADGIPGAELMVIHGAAHSMLIEDAEIFNSIALDFLESTGDDKKSKPKNESISNVTKL